MEISALDRDGNLTVLGLRLAEIPTEPQLAKLLLLGAVTGCLEPLADVASAIYYKNPIVPASRHKCKMVEKKKIIHSFQKRE